MFGADELALVVVTRLCRERRGGRAIRTNPRHMSSSGHIPVRATPDRVAWPLRRNCGWSKKEAFRIRARRRVARGSNIGS